jgi:hypothetical protein
MGPKLYSTASNNPATTSGMRFSLPKSRASAAYNVIKHEQHAKLALYASATFGSPTFKTFYNALSKGWLINYPSFTAKMLSRNQSHSPVTALGHITASWSSIRSNKPKLTNHLPIPILTMHDALATTRSQAQRPRALQQSSPVHKLYIHLELLASRTEAATIAAYARIYQWFSQRVHFVNFQVMDNEAPKGLW